jgi:hypothetical protein
MTAPIAAAASTVSAAVTARPASPGATGAHWAPADCCGGGYGGYGGGYGGACGGMYFHHGYWYDDCGDVLTADPNSWPHDH